LAKFLEKVAYRIGVCQTSAQKQERDGEQAMPDLRKDGWAMAGVVINPVKAPLELLLDNFAPGTATRCSLNSPAVFDGGIAITTQPLSMRNLARPSRISFTAIASPFPAGNSATRDSWI